MSFYGSTSPWPAQGRQPSWEEPAPPSRSGASAASFQQPESNAFASQFEEIDRATDNLVKSGKWFPGAVSPMASIPAAPGRRDSGPPAARAYEYNTADPRMAGSTRQPSVSEYDGGRPGSAGLQGYYAGQRFPGGRQSEAEQIMQAKRRMAAQRERELRNYHQEQQYNRVAVSGAKSDRSMSPNTMSEEDRRELIARQHRALYGDNSSIYPADGPGPRPQSQDARVPSTGRGQSPLAFEPFNGQSQAGAEGSVQMPTRDRETTTASPATSQAPQQQFAHLGEAQQSSRTSTSSPGASPPLGPSQKGTSGVAPIGTRPTQPPGSSSGLGKRATTPLTPSSLSYGFSSGDGQLSASSKDERSTSAASNPPLDKGVTGLGSWGGNGGGWGTGKSTLAVQPSVWG